MSCSSDTERWLNMFVSLPRLTVTDIKLGQVMREHATLLNGLPQVEMMASVRGKITISILTAPGKEQRDLLLTEIKTAIRLSLLRITDLEDDSLTIGASPLLTRHDELTWTIGFQLDASLMRISMAATNIQRTKTTQLTAYVNHTHEMV